MMYQSKRKQGHDRGLESSKVQLLRRAVSFGLEALESRRLLSASISGTVYNDANGNHVRDAGEAAVAGRQVYLDLQGIDKFVAGDPVATTDTNGAYSFTGLAAGNYLIRPVPVAGKVTTTPIWGGKFFVQLAANQIVTGDDFGIQAAGMPNFTVNGQLLIAGTANGQATLTRYNIADGSTDVTFGSLGVVTLPNSVTGAPISAVAQAANTVITYPTQIVTLNGAGGVLSIAPTGPITINAPTNLTATATSPTSVQLGFTDNSTNDNGFTIERSTSAGGPFISVGSLPGSVTGPSTGFVGFADNTAAANTTYYYRIYAVNGATRSAIAGPVNVTTPAGTSANYPVTDVGTLGADDGTTATGINNAGQVAGSSYLGSPFGGGHGALHAFRTSSTGVINSSSDISVQIPDNYNQRSYAYGINSVGQVTGYVGGTDGPLYAFRTTATGVIDANANLGTLGSFSMSQAAAINSSGQVVGFASNPASGVGGIDNWHAFTTTANGNLSTATDLTTGPGSLSVATGINDSGQTIGFYSTNDGRYVGFETTPTGIITAASSIGSLGGNNTDPQAINNAGQIAGISNGHIFRTGIDGKITPASDLGTMGSAFPTVTGINAKGQIVGAFYPGGNVGHAFFIDTNGSAVDLNDLIFPGSGWVLNIANAINDAGVIVGNGTYNGRPRAFELRPGLSGASISGSIYNDANNNGVRDNGEIAGAGQKVYLDLAGTDQFVTGDPVATTDASGHYTFSRVPAGNYLVRLVPQAGLQTTSPFWGGKYFVQLAANQQVTGDDFGIANLAGFTVGNQQLAYGSRAGANYVERFNADTSIDTTFGSLGTVNLPSPVTGNPTNAALQQNGNIVVTYPNSVVTLSNIGAILSVTGTAGASISGTVYNDANNNGIQDAGELPVAGRQVYLDLQGIGVFANGDPITTTDAGGHYSFTGLPAANYLVRLIPQAGTVITAPIWGGKYFVPLAANQVVTGDNFGTQSVSDTVIHNSFLVAPNGQLLVARPQFIDLGNEDSSKAAIVTRYNSDGSVDTTFGSAGSINIPLMTSFSFVASFPKGLLQLPNGNILVVTEAGHLSNNHSDETEMAVIDPSGKVIRALTVSSDSGSVGFSTGDFVDAFSVAPDGKILAAGRHVFFQFTNAAPQTLVVWRFNPDLTPDLIFGTNGRADITSVVGTPVSVTGLAGGGVRVGYLNTSVNLSNTGQLI